MEPFSLCSGIAASEERGRSVQLFHTTVPTCLHKPTCGGHDFLKPFEVHELEDGGLSFDTEKEAEYHFKLCEIYAGAIVAFLNRIKGTLTLLHLPVGHNGFSTNCS